MSISQLDFKPHMACDELVRTRGLRQYLRYGRWAPCGQHSHVALLIRHAGDDCEPIVQSLCVRHWVALARVLVYVHAHPAMCAHCGEDINSSTQIVKASTWL